MNAVKARKPRKIEAPTRPTVVPIAPKRPTREELMESVEPPVLSLADIVIIGKHGHESERLVLSGEDLAHVLSLCDRTTGGAYGLADNGDVNLMLRGLAELLEGHEDQNQLGGDGAYFLARTLDGLAAKLEANRHAEFSVFLRSKSAARKAGAA